MSLDALVSLLVVCLVCGMQCVLELVVELSPPLAGQDLGLRLREVLSTPGQLAAARFPLFLLA
jgi:hypothetical protein